MFVYMMNMNYDLCLGHIIDFYEIYILLKPDYEMTYSTLFVRADNITSTLKVNGYTFSKNNSTIFVFPSIRNGGQLLKKRICSNRSKFFLYEQTSFWNDYDVYESKHDVI